MNRQMRDRIWAGMGANSFGMTITIGTQLASLPLFLTVWDVPTYGVWLMLSTLPAYLAMADVGMVSAAGNQMAMAFSSGNTRLANTIFQSAQVFMLAVCALLLITAGSLVWMVPWSHDFSSNERSALSALSLGVLMTFAGGLSEQLFKATQRYPLGTMLGNINRLAEWAGWMLGLLLVGSFAAVAFTGLAFRAIGTVVVMMLASKNVPGMSWGVRDATLASLKNMIRPAAAFMAFPVANAISFQSITLLVGFALGPASVAVFNTYRTLARTTVQITALFSHSLWPEFTRLFGQNSTAELYRLASRSAWISAGQAVLLSGAVYMLTPFILEIWTHGRIAYERELLTVLLVYSVVAGCWHVPRVLLMATNTHGWLAIWGVLASLLCISLALPMSKVWGLAGFGWSMLISESAMALVCLVLTGRALGRYQRPAEVAT